MPQPPGTAQRLARPRRDAPEAQLVAALRAGDEEAFTVIVTTWHASLKRVARAYVRTDAIAEDVVQETWLAAIAGLERFEERASLRTWLFHILANRARPRAGVPPPRPPPPPPPAGAAPRPPPHRVAAPRARLVRRVDAWDDACAQRF